jgi:hypothetical protein
LELHTQVVVVVLVTQLPVLAVQVVAEQVHLELQMLLLVVQTLVAVVVAQETQQTQAILPLAQVVLVL